MENKSATEVIKAGKELLYEIVKSLYPDKQPLAAGRSDAAEMAFTSEKCPDLINNIPKFKPNEKEK